MHIPGRLDCFELRSRDSWAQKCAGRLTTAQFGANPIQIERQARQGRRLVETKLTTARSIYTLTHACGIRACGWWLDLGVSPFPPRGNYIAGLWPNVSITGSRGTRVPLVAGLVTTWLSWFGGEWSPCLAVPVLSGFKNLQNIQASMHMLGEVASASRESCQRLV